MTAHGGETPASDPAGDVAPGGRADTPDEAQTVVVRVTHRSGVHVHEAANWADALDFVRGWVEAVPTTGLVSMTPGSIADRIPR